MPIIAVGRTSEIATSTPMAESIACPQGLGTMLSSATRASDAAPPAGIALN